MKAPSRLLAQAGIVFTVAAAVIGISIPQASAFNSPEMPGRQSEVGLSRPSPDEPIDAQIEQAIDEVNEEGQAALEELGELDTPEKFDRAQEILQRLESTSREIRRRAHDRNSDRFDELNDLAIGRSGDQTRAELRDVGNGNTPEKRARAQAIRARNALVKARLEERWNNQRQRVAHRQSAQELPKADFRLPNGRPPLFAVAVGLRRRTESPTREQADQAIAQLKRDVQTATERLGELDTPGKVRRAQKMQARLKDRTQDLRRRAANQKMDQAKDQYQELAHELQHRAEVAISELGELDTPEKQEQARQINSKLKEALAALRERLGNAAGIAFEQRLDREIQTLQRRTEAALEELGTLDTAERQEKARLIRVRLAENIQKLRRQLARQAHTTPDKGFDQDSDGLRLGTLAALKELGRLDTPEKVRKARLIRVGMEEAINRLRNQRARQLDENLNPGLDALTDFLDNRGPGNAAHRVAGQRDGQTPTALRDRAELARQAREKAMTALRERREAQTRINDRLKAGLERAPAKAKARIHRAIKPKPDRPIPAPEGGARPKADKEANGKVKPAVTPEPTEIEPVRNDPTPESDSSEPDSERD